MMEVGLVNDGPVGDDDQDFDTDYNPVGLEFQSHDGVVNLPISLLFGPQVSCKV